MRQMEYVVVKRRLSDPEPSWPDMEAGVLLLEELRPSLVEITGLVAGRYQLDVHERRADGLHHLFPTYRRKHFLIPSKGNGRTAA